MKPHTTHANFANRLRNYGRMVSVKLESKHQTAGKLLGLSAAACAALSAHQAAEAAIKYSGPVNVGVGASFTWDLPKTSFSIDGLANFAVSAAWFPYYFFGLRFVAFGTTGSAPSNNNTTHLNVPGANGEQVIYAPGALVSGVPVNQPDKITLGQTIDTSAPWFAPAINGGGHNYKQLAQGNNYTPNASGALWLNPAYPNSYTTTNPNAISAVATGFAGIRFNTASNTNTTGGGPKHYGWVRLRIGNGGPGGFCTTCALPSSIQVLDWAYETTPDTAIMAGDGIVPPIDGDFDNDGDVDGFDFLLWQRDTSIGLLSHWETNFGETGGGPALAASSSAVPEPGTVTLLSLGLLATGAAGVRRQRNVKKG